MLLWRKNTDDSPIKTLNVKPLIPGSPKGVGELRNLWSVWNHDAENLFRSMNPDLWEETRKSCGADGSAKQTSKRPRHG
jgi:hypothetical protein